MRQSFVKSGTFFAVFDILRPRELYQTRISLITLSRGIVGDRGENVWIFDRIMGLGGERRLETADQRRETWDC